MEKYLPRCLDSILAQTYTNLEIILVNDGSIDSTKEICDKYADADARIKVIHKRNAGVAEARNTGLDAAQGEYISFVDPDDWIEPNMYQLLAKHIDECTVLRPEIVRFNAYRGQNILNPLPFNGLYVGDRLREEVTLASIGSDRFGGMFIMGVVWTYLYEQKFLQENKIRFQIATRLEDRLFVVSAFLRANNTLFVEDVFYHYENVEDSLSNCYNPNRWNIELQYMERLEKECLSSGLLLSDIKHRLRNDYLLRTLVSLHHEFFFNNPNGFRGKYKRVKKMITNPNVIDASLAIKKVKLRRKDTLILFFIKHRSAFLLTAFQEFILFVNKLKNKNG